MRRRRKKGMRRRRDEGMKGERDEGMKDVCFFMDLVLVYKSKSNEIFIDYVYT